jgi:hypothetical protein
MQTSAPHKERSPLGRLAKRAAVGLAPAALASLALFAAGCGSGSDDPGVAQAPTTSQTTTSDDSTGAGSPKDSRRAALVAFSACMRKHGLPNFPDPKPAGSGFGLTLRTENGIDVRSPQFKRAQQACKKLLPNGGKPNPQEQAEQLQAALRYSVCMRSHGVPNFPDPKATSDGGIEVGPGPKSSVDPDSPQFKAAEKACRQLLPGAGGGTSTFGGAR